MSGDITPRRGRRGTLLLALLLALAAFGFVFAGPASAATDPTGSWSAVYHCKVGWCAGQDFPATMTITSWDPVTGTVKGDYAGGPLTGTILNGQVKLTASAGAYSATMTGTISADGLSMSGSGTDTNGTSGTSVYTRRITGPTTTAPAGSPTSAGVSPTNASATPTTVAGPTSTVSQSHQSKAPVSGFLTLPDPSTALTLKNIGLAAGMSILLMLLVIFPSTMFNHTLEANLDVVRGWLPRFLRTRVEKDGEARSYWHSWRGFVTYMVFADLLYSLMQPGWGANKATVQSFISFMVGTAFTTSIGIAMTRTYLRRFGAVTGHMEVEFGTLFFAAVCVGASRLASFSPGYFYGVIAAYIPSRKPSESDRGRMAFRTVCLTYLLAVGGWLLFSPLDHVAKGAGFFGELPRGMAGGLVTGGAEAIVIGLIPLRFLPGHTLKNWNARIWAVTYLGGGFLFSLVLLHPGLVGAHESSVAWTIGLAVLFGVGSIAFWAYFRGRARRLELAQTRSTSGS